MPAIQINGVAYHRINDAYYADVRLVYVEHRDGTGPALLYSCGHSGRGVSHATYFPGSWCKCFQCGELHRAELQALAD